jgi:hypothetical protein
MRVVNHLTLPTSSRGALRSRFRKRHWIRLPRFLSPQVLKMLTAGLGKLAFTERRSPVSRREICPPLSLPVTLLLNHPEIFKFIEDVTASSKRIRSVGGMVCRHRSGAGHFVDWHNDLDYPPVSGRMSEATLVINLGGSYAGGTLEIKSPKTGKVIARVSNPRAGDALLFRSHLPHRNTPITGRKPKITFVAWFSFDELRLRPPAN